MPLVLLIQLASTWALVGIVWFLQIAHYPLMRYVGRDSFSVWQVQNMRLAVAVVAPVMLVETTTACLLLLWRPPAVTLFQVWLGIALLVVIWFTTLVLQVPAHGRLPFGFDTSLHAKLVRANWLRTLAWTARGVLVLTMAARAM